MEQGTKERLMSDVNAVLVDAEELLRQAAQSSGEQAADLRRRAQSAISAAKTRLVDVEHKVVDRPGMPPRRPIPGYTSIRGPQSASRPASAC